VTPQGFNLKFSLEDVPGFDSSLVATGPAPPGSPSGVSRGAAAQLQLDMRMDALGQQMRAQNESVLRRMDQLDRRSDELAQTMQHIERLLSGDPPRAGRAGGGRLPPVVGAEQR
jgi:hypothetical protein